MADGNLATGEERKKRTTTLRSLTATESSIQTGAALLDVRRKHWDTKLHWTHAREQRHPRREEDSSSTRQSVGIGSQSVSG